MKKHTIVCLLLMNDDYIFCNNLISNFDAYFVINELHRSIYSACRIQPKLPGITFYETKERPRKETS